MADTAMLFTELERLYQRQVNSRAYELRLAELGESDPASDEWKSASMAATMAEVEFGSALLRNYSTISRVLREAAEGLRPISEAKKDGTIIWAKMRDDIYPVLQPEREDLARWNGVQVPLRHPGLAEDGFDIGWSIAAPVGNGGFPDEWIEGWRRLPPPPSTEATNSQEPRHG